MIHIPQLRKQAQPGPATGTKHSFLLVALGAGLAFSSPPPLLFLFMPWQLLIQPPWLWSARWLQAAQPAADLLSCPGGGEGRSSLSVPTPKMIPFSFLKNVERHVPGPVQSTSHATVLFTFTKIP